MNKCVTCGKSIPAEAFFCESCKENPVVPPADSLPLKTVDSPAPEAAFDSSPLPPPLSINPVAKGLNVFLWLLSILGGLYGGLILISGMKDAQSAPQQAAVAGMAVGYAVIPYCISRAVGELINLRDR